MKQKGSNINTIKADNNGLVLKYIRKRPISRAEISKATGLTKSAVSTIVKQLIEYGLIVESGTESSELGRHPIMLEIVRDFRFSVAISIRRNEISVGIVDLMQECICSDHRASESFKTAEEALLWGYRRAFELANEKGLPKEHCIGIGVSAPGPLDYKNGVILTPPNFSLMHNFDVKECLGRVTDIPVFLNNAPVLMALYENIKRPEEIKNYIFIVVDNGVGSAIIKNGSVYRGSRGFSGEIGHICVDFSGQKCTCGNRGCLEGYITAAAIERQFGKDYKSIVNGAISGDQEDMQAIEKIADIFSAGIINAVNLLDLEAVMILGELGYKSELLFEIIRKNIAERSMIAGVHRVEILPSVISDEGDISYVASAVTENFFSNII